MINPEVSPAIFIFVRGSGATILLNRSVEGAMKRLSVLSMLVLVLAFLMISCGGGGGSSGSGSGDSGGGGTGGVTYSGLTTQASLTAANANKIFTLVWNDDPSSVTTSSSPKVSNSKGADIVPLAKRLLKIISINASGFSGSSKNVSRMIPVNETRPGTVSGTLTMTGSIDDASGTGSITESFANFNDGDGYTYDGNVQLQINGYDMAYQVTTDGTISFTLWTIKSTNGDISLTGSMRRQVNVQNKSETLTVNMDGRDNIINETFRFDNFVVTTVYDNQFSPTSGTETYSGREYFEKFGYVEISTVSPLIYSDLKTNPSSGGPIILAGAANSKALITPFSYGVKIEVDDNGDSLNNSINRYFWDNLAGPVFTSITVAPPAPNVPAGMTQHFTATGTFSDSSTKDLTSIVTWTSSNTTIAEISSREGTYSWCWDFGCAMGMGLGTTTIMANLGDMSGSATMEVSPAVIVSLVVTPPNPYVSPIIAMGTTFQFMALGTFSTNYRDDVTSSVTWSSSDNAIATISNAPGSKGLASAISSGTTTITATSGAVSASTTLTVTDWTLHNSGVSSDLYRVAWAGSQFVAAGANGIILTSSDGKTFQQRSSGTSTALYDVARSGNTFVVVGDGGTVLTSSDGVMWTPQVSGTTNSLYGAVWSGSKFVAVGAYGTILTSLNGTVWTPQVSGTTNNLHGLAWSGNKFVAVGGNGTILTSPDGTAWTLQTSDTLNPLGRVAWSGLQFVAVSGSPYDNYYLYAYPIHISTDGISWSSVPIVPSSTVPPSFIWTSSDVIWCGTQFIVVGEGGYIFKSGDGVNWSSWVSGTTSFLSTVSCSPTQYVVAGKGGLFITFP